MIMIKACMIMIIIILVKMIIMIIIMTIAKYQRKMATYFAAAGHDNDSDISLATHVRSGETDCNNGKRRNKY